MDDIATAIASCIILACAALVVLIMFVEDR